MENSFNDAQVTHIIIQNAIFPSECVRNLYQNISYEIILENELKFDGNS